MIVHGFAVINFLFLLLFLFEQRCKANPDERKIIKIKNIKLKRERERKAVK